MLRQKEVLDRDETGMIFNVDTTTTTNRQPANVRHNPLKKRELEYVVLRKKERHCSCHTGYRQLIIRSETRSRTFRVHKEGTHTLGEGNTVLRGAERQAHRRAGKRYEKSRNLKLTKFIVPK